jgi:hypothetical protein
MLVSVRVSLNATPAKGGCDCMPISSGVARQQSSGCMLGRLGRGGLASVGLFHVCVKGVRVVESQSPRVLPCKLSECQHVLGTATP